MDGPDLEEKNQQLTQRGGRTAKRNRRRKATVWRSENATPESKKPQTETWAELSLENKLLGGGATSSSSENNTHDDKDRVEWRQHQHGPKRCREAASFFKIPPPAFWSQHK